MGSHAPSGLLYGRNRRPGESARHSAARTPIQRPNAAATSTPRPGGGCRHGTQEAAETAPAPGGPWTASNRSYWRAAIAAHLGEKDRAVDLLAEAFSQGWSYSIGIHAYFDLEPIWDYPPFQELIEPKG